MDGTASPADPSMFLVLHGALCTDARRLVSALERLVPGDRRRARALERWYGALRRQLHAHHRAEEEVFFPALSRRVPGFVDGDGAQMTDDHRYLDALTESVGERLHRLASVAAEERAAALEAAVVDAMALAGLLADHVAHEERIVVPRFAEHVDAAEFARLSARADRFHRPRDLWFAVPWFFDHLARCERSLVARVLPQVPATMRPLAVASGPSYRRLVRAAGIA